MVPASEEPTPPVSSAGAKVVKDMLKRSAILVSSGIMRMVVIAAVAVKVHERDTRSPRSATFVARVARIFSDPSSHEKFALPVSLLVMLIESVYDAPS